MADQGTSSKKSWRTIHQTRAFWIIVLIILVLVVLIKHSFKSNNTNQLPLTEVVLSASRTANVPVYVTAIGNVTPTYSVTVKTQINGILMNVFFKEGQLVKKGDLLAQIDPRPYEAQLVQYEGQLKRDQALLANARIDLKRYQTLWKQNSTSQQILQTQISLVQQDEGNVKADLGLIQATKVNLIYTRITSPIDGRVGLRLVDPGNFVQTSDTTGLMVINTLNPITVIFTIPEVNIPDVAKLIYDNKPVQIQALTRDENKLLATTKQLTIDNQIDPTTGTVKLRASFANDDNRLFPSQFVNIKLLVKTVMNAVVVPTAAVQYSENGAFVYRLNNNLTVSVTPVKVGVTTGDRTSIASGLATNQLIITEGGDKLSNGAKVTIAPASQALLQPSVRLKLPGTKAENTSRRFWS